MSRRDASEAQRLDQHFEEILARIKPYLLKLPVSSESRLCRLWLERLNRADEQRNLRNDYLFELYKQLKNGYLKSPFNKPPDASRLIPIAKFHRLATSSSCNELTETSQSLCEQKRSFQKPRSKSLKREPHLRRSRIPTRQHYEARSSSPSRSPSRSPDRSSRTENGSPSPTVHFCEMDTRADRSTLHKYKERIEKLSTIVENLENRNEKMKQKLMYYRSASAPDEIPHLHARIKHLMIEIESLKKKLNEVQELKAVLEQTHEQIVERYRRKMTEQFTKMKRQLENARLENQELNSKIAVIENKLQELNRQKDETVKLNEKDWEQKVQCVKMEYESLLQNKEVELRMKDQLVQQKENELIHKLEEIDALHAKLKDLQELVDMKYQEEGKLHSLLVAQYKSIKDDLTRMRDDIEIASKRQNDSHHQEISSLKRNVTRLEKLTQKLQQEYEEKLFDIVKEKDGEIIDLTTQLNNNNKCDPTLKFLEKQFQIDPTGQPNWDNVYNILLTVIKTAAKDKRCKRRKQLMFLEDQIRRLRSG